MGAQATWCGGGQGSSHRTGGTWAACVRREGASRTTWMGQWGQGPLAAKGSSAEGRRGSRGRTEKAYFPCLHKGHRSPSEGARVSEGVPAVSVLGRPQGVLAPKWEWQGAYPGRRGSQGEALP